MKGIVFTEFIELVENAFGLEVADQIIESSQLSTGGAYTKVGTYDHHELLRLVSNLSLQANVPVPELVNTFGQHLFKKFAVDYPVFFERAKGTFDLLESVQDVIHVEVRKLYPDAELPEFEVDRKTNEMVLTYRSARPFADLAQGLIEACIAFYGEPIELNRTDLDSAEGTASRFVMTVQLPVHAGD